MKRGVRRLVASVAPEAPPGGVRVLLYHAVDEADSADHLSLRVARPHFLEQMRVLRDDGYTVVPLAAVSGAHDEAGRRRVAITFDDGYRSQAWAAAVLREFGFPATFFLVPRFLDGVPAPAAYWEAWGHLRWDEAASLLEGGFEIGAHSATHPDLRSCSDARLEEEVAGGRRRLEQGLGCGVLSFSYPFGRHDTRVRRAVECAGFQIGCTSRFGVNRASGPTFAVRRTEVSGTDDLREFRMKLVGRYDWLGSWQDLRPA